MEAAEEAHRRCHLPLDRKKNHHPAQKAKCLLADLKVKYRLQEPKVENPAGRKAFHLKKQALQEKKFQVKYPAKDRPHAVEPNAFEPSTVVREEYENSARNRPSSFESP